MLGGMFAGHEEGDGEIVEKDGEIQDLIHSRHDL